MTPAPYAGGMDDAVRTGSLVQIRGVYDLIEEYDIATGTATGASIAVEGQVGRCLGVVGPSGELGDAPEAPLVYAVQLFDGRSALLERRYLQEWAPAAPEQGGFDVAWPPDMPEASDRSQAMGYCAFTVAEALSRKGWCLIQMTDESLVREEACSEARTLKYSAPRAELLADYLGHGGEGKTSTLEYHRVNQDPTWALAELDGELTALAKSLTPLTGEALGFQCTGRRKGLATVQVRLNTMTDNACSTCITH